MENEAPGYLGAPAWKSPSVMLWEGKVGDDVIVGIASRESSHGATGTSWRWRCGVVVGGVIFGVVGAVGWQLEEGEVWKDCDVCPEMVEVPGGAFKMGSPEAESGRQNDEGPQHDVEIERFAMGVKEVTFREWDACVSDKGCDYTPYDNGWGRDDHPVICVSWDDAHAYLSWLSEITEAQYRLPSEAEWEYAARGGTTTARYWGESELGQCRYANGNGGKEPVPCPDGYEGTAPVGSYKPNSFGLYDVLGNVWEWVGDCWHEDYHEAPSNGSAWIDGSDCNRRVVRGGSWVLMPRYSRSANRSKTVVANRKINLGFRVAKTLGGNRQELGDWSVPDDSAAGNGTEECKSSVHTCKVCHQ